MNAEENELLCRIGPGSAMGALVRHYWVPAFTSSQLPTAESDPIRVRVFGENYVAFRGDDGAIGFLDEACPHRGASLVMARNEGCALRCLYHGWKIGADGTVLETPNAESSALRAGLRARSYPVQESHGLAWVYLGPPATVPERPRYAWESVPESNTLVVDVELDCNWLQALEGLLDSSHTGVLHSDIFKKFPPSMRADGDAVTRALLPRIEVQRTDFGIHYGAIRADAGSKAGLDQVRITAWAAPFICFIAPGGMMHAAIPVDDTHTRFLNLWWDADERLDSGPGYEQRIDMWGLSADILALTGMTPTMPPKGEIPRRNAWPQDRAAMRSGESFSGLPGLTAEDGAIAVAMGPIVDRTKEHLVAADVAITRTRRLLLKEARAVAAGDAPANWHGGKTPFAAIKAASGDLAPGADWRDLVPDHLAE